MLAALSDMKITTKLLQETAKTDDNLIDANYAKLKCKLTTLKSTDPKYKICESMFDDAKCKSDKIIDIFEIDRSYYFSEFIFCSKFTLVNYNNLN